MEKVELYGGMIYTLPKQPAKESIMNFDLPKKEQKWKRPQMPKEFEGLTKEETDDLVENNEWAFNYVAEEFRRCIEGFWFFNNGVPTFITGDHYHFLTWFKIDVGYPDYRDRDRRWFYFDEICAKDIDCFGSLYMKHRRDGFSYRAASIELNLARRTENGHFGMMSKTGDDAKDLFQKIVFAFQEYPEFFKPQVQSAEDVKKELLFKAPIQRVTHKTKSVKKQFSLNTRITWKNTKENSYDGLKLQRIIGDECGKFEEANYEKWHDVVKTCLRVGNKIIGKAMMGSTVNEAKKGGAAFVNVWRKSCYKERNENNRTLSGLYRYFVPAYDGMEGFIDEYGMSVIETPTKPVMGIDGLLIKQGAKQFLENEAEALRLKGEISSYYEFKRQNPCTEEDALRDPSNERPCFDLDRIYAQIDYNNSLPHLPLTRGNFVWKNGVQYTIVEFQEDANGRWLIAWMPKLEDRNKCTMEFGRPTPLNNHVGVFGVDPFDHKHTSSGKRSDAASYGLKKFDPMNPLQSNMFVTEYINRPESPDILYDDMIKQCVFYGWKILPENNRIGLIRHFENKGYSNYVMDRPAETHSEWSEKHQGEKKGIPMSGEEPRRALVEGLQSYIYKNIGLVDPETQTWGNCYFNRLLTDWSKFDVEKWTDFDATVASGLAVLASREYVPKKQEALIDLNEWFPQFKIKGNMSVKI